MPAHIIRTNFLLTDRMRNVIDAFMPRRARGDGADDMLPYLAWALGVRQMDGPKVIKQSGPGYVLGAIERDRINEGIVVAIDNNRPVAFALRDAYNDQLRYTVDCVDRKFTVVASR